MFDWLTDLWNSGDGGGDYSFDSPSGQTGAVDQGYYDSGSSDGSWFDNLDLSGWDGSNSFMQDMFSNGSNYGSSGTSDGELFIPSGGDYNSISPADNYSTYDQNQLIPNSGSSSVFSDALSKLKKGTGMDMSQLLKLGLGAGLSYLGNKSTANANQDQAQSNLSNYLSNVTWTPERTASYTNAVRNNVSGLLSGQLAQGKGTLAEQLASAGRGGGSYGKASDKLTRDMLNKLASTTNSAIQTTSTPPNLAAGAFAIPADTSTGTTLSNISGMLGNLYNQDYTSKLLQQLLNQRG